MTTRTTICALTAALALAAVAGAAPPPRADLYGVVLLGPTRPVCETGVPCEAPEPGVTLVFARLGRVVGSVTTSRTGAYRILLPAGTYAVHTTRKFHGGLVAPPTVRVRAAERLRVAFHLDSGIR
jgi:hypothetical protein